jgi:hypothetical protein
LGNDHYVTGSKRQATVETMGFEDDYWETGLGFQRWEERYWDTGDLWEKVDRFRVTCPRSKHFGRYDSVIGISKKRLWVVFDDMKKPGSFVERTMVVHALLDWESSRRVLKAKREYRNYAPLSLDSSNNKHRLDSPCCLARVLRWCYRWIWLGCRLLGNVVRSRFSRESR